MAKKVRKVFYDKDFVPKNLEELYCSGWKEYLIYHIRKYSLNDINHSVEDLLQDMMIQLASTNYIENYDPEVAEFTVYLKTFVRNFMSKPYAKEHRTKHGSNIVNHLSIVSSVDDNDSTSTGNVITTDILGSNTGDFTDYICLSNTIKKDLAQIKTKSQVEYEGKVIKRSPLTVYTMLQSGYDIKEIADIFGTSKQFVYDLRKKIMNVITSYA